MTISEYKPYASVRHTDRSPYPLKDVQLIFILAFVWKANDTKQNWHTQLETEATMLQACGSLDSDC